MPHPATRFALVRPLALGPLRTASPGEWLRPCAKVSSGPTLGLPRCSPRGGGGPHEGGKGAAAKAPPAPHEDKLWREAGVVNAITPFAALWVPFPFGGEEAGG